MVLLISVIILIIIVCLISIIYLLFKQKESFNSLINDHIFDREFKKDKYDELIEIIPNNKFNKLLLESKDNPDDLEILEKDIQDRLRKFVKISDLAKARQCNEQLKKINLVRKKEI